MLTLLLSGLRGLLVAFFAAPALAAQNLALRQQLAALSRQASRPRLRRTDRLFWVVLRRLWSGWRDALVLVRPETVIGWHRQGFRIFGTWEWRWGRGGRPRTDPRVRSLIKAMAKAKPTWGTPRIHGELLMLGVDISERTVGRWMPKARKPPSQTRRSVLENHVKDIASMDFFVVPTVTCRVLYVLVTLRNDRRRIVHVNVTEHPTAEWTVQQVVEAFPWDEAPRFLMRDRDGIYGAVFSSRVKGLGIEEVKSAPRSTWQNPWVEPVIGSIRRELTDRVIVLGRRHLLRLLNEYLGYYNESRTHLSLGKDSPTGREVHGPELGEVEASPQVGGLHHRYERRAA